MHILLASRCKLESLFQPLIDAISFHDAFSDTEDLFESAYSPHANPRPSFSKSSSPGPSPNRAASLDPSRTPEAQSSTPADTASHSNGAAAPVSKPQSAAAQHDVTDAGQSAAAGVPGSASSNGGSHALTSSHYSAEPATESAEQAKVKQVHAAARQHSAGARVEKAANLEGLLEVYEDPDYHAGLYNYARALEDAEAGLLAGFFFKHFCLASHVIGSESKGRANLHAIVPFWRLCAVNDIEPIQRVNHECGSLTGY